MSKLLVILGMLLFVAMAIIVAPTVPEVIELIFTDLALLWTYLEIR
jgi:hypothetical protein